MNRCPEYSCKNGKPNCQKDNYWYKDKCVKCLLQNDGVYPSQIPKLDMSSLDIVVDDKTETLFQKAIKKLYPDNTNWAFASFNWIEDYIKSIDYYYTEEDYMEYLVSEISKNSGIYKNEAGFTKMLMLTKLQNNYRKKRGTI